MKIAGLSSIRTLIGVMVIVVIAGVLIARSYYERMNRSVDPRVVPARELYSKYNSYAREGDYYRVFALLDSVEQIYRATTHYDGSFELGVLDNNRAAAFLTLALFGDSIPGASHPYLELGPDSLVTLAEIHVRRAIGTYLEWNQRFVGKSTDQIIRIIGPEFLKGLQNGDPEMEKAYLENRAGEIENALIENDRRLSVCYTNLGLAYRFRGAYEEAARHYEKALELWDRNLDAENNLNRLLNRPVRKRNIIQKLFPPDRRK
jgi:tetratricopeptide (TPR) repeat protein